MLSSGLIVRRKTQVVAVYICTVVGESQRCVFGQ